MPLPDGAPLSLQVNANAIQSKPKRAMIVRMSAETLDALDAFPHRPPLSFDFGDVPGIYIGESFFPMRPQKESSPHELYLRAASAAKPMAPLKLYANVIGKFMVERQLGDKVTDKVRQQTMVAKQQHMERQAILLDQPPISVHATKNAKRKMPGSGTVVKKTAPSDQHRLAPTSTVPSRKVSPLPQSSRANPDVRRRLVHCLAISPRLSEDAVKMVGGANISISARDDLLALLDDLAEQHAPAKKGDKSPRPWALKPQTWIEVRPFEWPKLTETERITMARQARMAFKALKIPESDPAWDNVRYRATAPAIPTSVPAPPPMAATNSSRSSTSAQPETKRSAITAKDIKLKSKQDAPRVKGEIQVKDESTKATASRLNAIKRAVADRPTAPPSDGGSAAKTVASRRLPGSGYQVKKSPQPTTGVAEKSGTPVDTRPAPKPSLPASLPPKPSPAGGTHARKTIPTMPPKPMKKEDESDHERDIEYDHQREREREREKREREKEKRREERERERERERVEMEKREKAKQKEREAMEREKRQREKEREREEMEQDKRQREKERIRAAGSTVPAFKRKTAMQDTEETLDNASSKASLPKRRKLDDGTSVASSSSKVRDTELPKKPAHEPSPVPRLKMKKEPSSPQASVSSQDRRATASASGSTHKSERPSKASGSAKPRRRSPIYTSSEDEGEIPQPRKRNLSPPPISDRSNSSDQPQSEKAPRHHRTTRRAYPSATDHTALRALYQSQYSTYLGTFSKVVAQKRKIEAMLNGDSEAEGDVMEPDDLIKLSMEHKSLKTELEHIHDIYTRGTTGAAATGGGGSTSD